MAKSKEKIKARSLRRKGLSIKKIASRLGVSKSSASVWCSGIKLTEEQIGKLHKQMVIGGYSGRLKGASIQKEQKRSKINYYLREGEKNIGVLSDRELAVAGIALYWGEGGKKDSRVRFYNSDYLVIRFIMTWFRKVLGVREEDFIMRVTVNGIHEERIDEINNYWSRITNIPMNQFGKAILIKTKNKKVYENHFQHYGTLCVGIKKSSTLFYKIMGLIKALGGNA
jgi:transcriptional regulator with XRE-family HTH domain